MSLLEDMAREYRDSVPSWDELIREPSKPPPPKYLGAFVHEIAGQAKARDWLIKGAVLARTFSLVIGQPGSGKSFLILDYALTAALSALGDIEPKWFGRRIKPCGVVYVSAEGQEDFNFRIQAWLERMNLAGSRLPFYLIPTAVDLCNSPDGARQLAEEIKAKGRECEAMFGVSFSVCVIDTVSRALSGGDENSPVAMGAFVKNCGYLKETCEMAVIGVHHTPNGSERARGHSALHGATDAEIIVAPPDPNKPGSTNQWRIGRSKCGPAGEGESFRLRQHKLGVDEDGDDITSCVVAWVTDQESSGFGRF